MKNSKFHDLISSFSTEELKKLADFCHSPYFNKNEDVKCLASIVYKQKAAKLDPVHLWHELFPKKTFNAKKWSYLASSFLRLGEEFIALEQIKQQPARWELIHLQASAKRGLKKSYRRQSRRFKELISTPNERNQDLLRMRYDFSFLEENQAERSRQPRLEELLKNLEADYLAKKWQIGCAMLIQQELFKNEYVFSWFGPDDSYDDLAHSEQANLFRNAYRLQQTPNQLERLIAFVDSLQTSADFIEKEAQTALIQIALNYCIRQIRAGHTTFSDQLLALYKIGLDRGYLLRDGKLSPFNYKNIVKLGLGLGQFAWVKEIIESYTGLLPAHTREDAYHYSMADLYYYQHKYEQSLGHLRDTEFTDVHYALGARAMLLKIYFEQGETEPMHALFSSFYIYLLREKKVGKGTKDAYMNFLRFTKKLDRMQNIDSFNKLRTKVSECNSLNDRNWLLSQIEKRIQVNA
ncbi:MAG: hypothetical protein AAGF87_14255 [Bacteroidota bacterium]